MIIVYNKINSKLLFFPSFTQLIMNRTRIISSDAQLAHGLTPFSKKTIAHFCFFYDKNNKWYYKTAMCHIYKNSFVNTPSPHPSFVSWKALAQEDVDSNDDAPKRDDIVPPFLSSSAGSAYVT